MRLDYEQVLDTNIAALKIAQQTLQNIQANVTSNPYITNYYDLFRGTTSGLNSQLLMGKIKEKLGSTVTNTVEVLNRFCTYVQFEPTLGALLDIQEDYDNYLGRININGDDITYSGTGAYTVIVKKMVFKHFEGISVEQSRDIFLSRAAREVRASQCLLNPMNYNLNHKKFPNVLRNIEDRISALSAIIRTKADRIQFSDAFTAMDCKIFTPISPGSHTGVSELNENSRIYLAYPLLDQTLDNMFFFSPLFLQEALQELGFQNNLDFRLRIFFKMIQSLESLHNTGLIHRNIKLSTIYFKKFTKAQGSAFNQHFIMYGNFIASGIDDYGASLTPGFYTPRDDFFTTGPSLDIFQLGIAFAQIIYLIPTSGWTDLTLDKIALLTNPDALVNINSRQIHLFEQLMIDVSNNVSDLSHYGHLMNMNCAYCFRKIVYEIYMYLKHSKWDFNQSDDYQLRKTMYRFKPKDPTNFSMQHIYKDPIFSRSLLSYIINFIPNIPDCVPKNFSFSTNMKYLIHSMVDPDPEARTSINWIKEDLRREMNSLVDYPRNNIKYFNFDMKTFVKSNTRETFGTRKVKSIRMI
jgi:serine/threonine protein kinase